MYAVPQGLQANAPGGGLGGGLAEELVLTKDQAQRMTRAFIQGFTRSGIAIYREHLLHNARGSRFFLEIDLEEVQLLRERVNDDEDDL